MKTRFPENWHHNWTKLLGPFAREVVAMQSPRSAASEDEVSRLQKLSAYLAEPTVFVGGSYVGFLFSLYQGGCKIRPSKKEASG